MKANGKLLVAVVFVTGFVLGAVTMGCGVKTSPIPPKSIAPEAITDLAFTLGPGQATLRWSIPLGRSAGTAGLGGFLVYRAMTPASEPVCDGCPVLYRPIAKMDAETLLVGAPNRKNVTLVQPIDPGYHYIFKVIAYSKDGQRGPDSNLVVIE